MTGRAGMDYGDGQLEAPKRRASKLAILVGLSGSTVKLPVPEEEIRVVAIGPRVFLPFLACLAAALACRLSD